MIVVVTITCNQVIVIYSASFFHPVYLSKKCIGLESGRLQGRTSPRCRRLVPSTRWIEKKDQRCILTRKRKKKLLLTKKMMMMLKVSAAEINLSIILGIVGGYIFYRYVFFFYTVYSVF
jgi:hypothetical protein